MADKFKIIANREMGSGYRPGDEKTYMNLNYNPPVADTTVDTTAPVKTVTSTGPRHTDVHGNDIPQNVDIKTVTPAETVATPAPTPTYIHSEGETFIDKNSTMGPSGGGGPGVW